MSKAWQVIDVNGDVLKEDDASSMGSDWSFIHSDFEADRPNRSYSSSTIFLTTDADSNDLNDTHSNQQTDCEDPPTVERDTGNRVCTRSGAASRVTVSSAENRRRRRRRSANTEFSQAYQSTTRWNATRSKRSQRNNLNVDSQRSKCLRRGAMVSHGFQRFQAHFGRGDKGPHQRS